MTAATTLPGFDPELLGFLDEHDVRYEIIDGSLVVTPPATFSHERLVVRLAAALLAAAPDDIAVLGSSFGFYYEAGSFVMADVTVARAEHCREDGIHVAPLLVVEVLSPSTRRTDLARKREIYEEAGVPSYWVVDPLEPSLTVLSLRDGRYDETSTVTVGGELVVQEPFPMSFVPFPRNA